MFGDHKYCISRGIMFFVCQVISQGNEIKRPCVYIDRSSLILNGSQQPGKLGDHGHCGSVDIIGLLCEVILQDHVTKELNKFDDGNCSIRSTILPSFVPLVILVGEIY